MQKEYENLANAIVMQAVDDYRCAVAKLKKTCGKPHPARRDDRATIEANAVKMDTERFFKSDWFGALTALDGRVLLADLQKEQAKGV